MALLYGKTVNGDYVAVQVTADGQIVSVTDSTGLTVSWDDVTGKPTTFPSDWDTTADKPSTFPSTWDDVTGKPTTFPSDWEQISSKPAAFPTTWNLITGTPETFPCTWLELQDKPSTFPSDWSVISSKPSTFPSTWGDVTGKPTTFPSDWSIISSKPSTFPSDWSIISSKPSTFPSTWGDVTGKPTVFPPEATSGTWTPSMESLTPVAGVTYASRGGTWYRMGSLIFLTAQIALSAHANQTGRIVVRGLPVAPLTGLEPNGGCSVVNWDNYVGVSNSTLAIYGGIRASVATDGFVFNRVRQGASQTSPSLLNWSDVGQTFLVDFTATYRV